MDNSTIDRNSRILAAVERQDRTLAEIGRDYGITATRVASIALHERARVEWIAAVIAERDRPLLDRRVAYLPISARTRRYLTESVWAPGYDPVPALETVRDVLAVSLVDLLRRPNIGVKSVLEFQEFIRREQGT